MKPVTYKQCYLVKDLSSPTWKDHPLGCPNLASRVAWIPSKYAVKGKVLRLKDEDGEWEPGWKVCSVYGEEKDGDRLLALNSIYRGVMWATKLREKRKG